MRRSASRTSVSSFDLETNAPAEQIAQLIKLTERYCVVFQTLKQSPGSEVVVNTKAA
jgi:uncharacterized OsmC-like protein